MCILYLLCACLLVWLATLGGLLHHLVPVVLQLDDGVLQLSGAVELLVSDALLQGLLGFQDPYFHLRQLAMEGESRGEGEMERRRSSGFTADGSCCRLLFNG